MNIEDIAGTHSRPLYPGKIRDGLQINDIKGSHASAQQEKVTDDYYDEFIVQAKKL